MSGLANTESWSSAWFGRWRWRGTTIKKNPERASAEAALPLSACLSKGRGIGVGLYPRNEL